MEEIFFGKKYRGRPLTTDPTAGQVTILSLLKILTQVFPVHKAQKAIAYGFLYN